MSDKTEMALVHAGEYVLTAAQVRGGAVESGLGSSSSNITNHNYKGDIVLPGVTNYEEFKAALTTRYPGQTGLYRGVS